MLNDSRDQEIEEAYVVIEEKPTYASEQLFNALLDNLKTLKPKKLTRGLKS